MCFYFLILLLSLQQEAMRISSRLQSQSTHGTHQPQCLDSSSNLDQPGLYVLITPPFFLCIPHFTLLNRPPPPPPTPSIALFSSLPASLSMPHSNTENRQEKRPQAPRQERTNLGDERQPVDLERISRPAGRRDLTLRRSAVTV